MSDAAFVRKRTSTLLQITANGFPGENTLNNNRNGTMKIDKKTFDWLVDAWAYSGQSDSSDIALALLNRMEELSNSAEKTTPKAKLVSPDSKTYTKVLNAIARSGKADAGAQAERLLNEMIDNGLRPNTLTYTYVIDAHSRSASPESPMNAQRLVEQMETLRASGDTEVKPTSRAWNSVIKSWSSQGDASKASACLDIMESLADNTGNDDVRPNSYNCNAVISAWAKSGEPMAASKAEKILEKMERMYASSGEERFQPTTETYNAIIDAWAKSGQIDAPNRAELLLGYMMELYETGHNTAAKPNVRSFNSVMNAWAKSADVYAPEKAADILRRMEDLRGDLRVKPDATSFATAINAYARSLNYGKADAAYNLFLKMNKMYDLSGSAFLKPNNIVYNSVLNACAFTIGDIEEQCRAIEIANEVFTAMKQSGETKPDEVTYGTYLKVITNQMPVGRQRDKVVQAIFEKASQDGMVGTLVEKVISNMAPSLLPPPTDTTNMEAN
jgi:hypothetical protein